MSESVFTKIINRELPASIVYENDKVIAIEDINPQAKIHLLFIHKEATKNVNQMTETKPEQLKDIFEAVLTYTREQGIEEDGFRVVTNINKFGCQTVFHTHFHLLAGEQLGGFS